jgi:hypothetical protein
MHTLYSSHTSISSQFGKAIVFEPDSLNDIGRIVGASGCLEEFGLYAIEQRVARSHRQVCHNV